ncbi:MAG: bifunctional lysylphosphatidylglycerol flippase/synthetase MprF [Gemmatimonadetes bacterium]|nr:bifunctional lysylphosphatidylglycerol flippase/synthetase MprF [Gemmatimonadota bacterium]
MIPSRPSHFNPIGSRATDRDRTRTWIRAVLGALLFAAALFVLHRELRHVHYRDVLAALHSLPPGRVLAGALLVLLNYLVLTGYDRLAFHAIGQRIAGWQVTLASFVAYALSNNIGFALIAGTSVRDRFYSRWGVGTGDLTRIVVFYSTSFWLGLSALGGWSLALQPHPALLRFASEPVLRTLGVLVLLFPVAYLLASALRRAPLRVRGLQLQFPPPRLALLQVLLSAVEWSLAGAVLYARLPAGGPGFGALLGVFLAAQLAGLVSHVPGGVGVFETVLLVTLGRYYGHTQIVSSLLLYRLLYYLLPLGIALAILVGDELRLRRHHLARLGTVLGSITAQTAPALLALFTFIAGVVLLISGATPADPGRVRWLAEHLPLAVLEASHFLGSVVGVALLILAQGIARRLDGAWYLGMVGLALGVALSLLKGGDYEEALLLGVLLAALLGSRDQFDRRAAFLDAPFSPGWTVAAVAALGASIWLGFFAYKNVQYGSELWWRFALNHDVSRFLRASVGATVSLLASGVARLARPAAAEIEPPGEPELAAAAQVVAAQAGTLPFLVLLRDKGVLFNEERTGFVMYGVQGRTWVALGDPVGPPAVAPGLIRQFLERASDYGAIPVFYQVGRDRLDLYAELGLTFAKLGEEARVELAHFGLEGQAQRGLRATVHRLQREGVEFAVLPPEEVRRRMAELRAVSDEWLSTKATSEKGFSLGRFDEDYLARFPAGVMTVGGEIVAFGNLWLGRPGSELSVDLMRFRSAAPRGAMDGLFTQLLLWGKAQGYAWFSLGMAPLSGLEAGPLGHAWARIGHLVFRYGEAFYNFQGLRTYKEKFHPVWEARFLAYPGGLRLPRVIADVAALVAGGYGGILKK